MSINNKFISKISAFALATMYIPLVTFAADGIVPDCQPDGVCKFTDFQALGDNILAFFISIVIPIAVIGISIVGVKMVMSADNAKGATEAKTALWNVVWGIAVAIGAVIIIKLVFSTLGGGDIPSIN